MKFSNLNAGYSVSFGQKVAFGIGMLANQMFPAVLGIFMVVLVQDLGFPPESWALLFFLPRIFDSVTDPIMGFISDNTRSVWGRRRPYVFIGAIIMGISFIMMWQLYRENTVDYNFTYFLVWSFLFYLGLTIFSVPYVAMGYEMSEDFHERTHIMAIAQWIGQWAWVIAPWFWVIMYDKGWFPNADTATRNLAVWVGVICMLFAMVPALFIKSNSTKNDTSLIPITFKNIGSNVAGLAKGFKAAFTSIPFLRLCISTFLIFNAFNTIAAFSFFIIVYYLFNGDAGAAGIWPTLFGSLGALITTFVVIPIVTKMSKGMGKKKAFIWSQSISIIGYVLLWFLFIPGKPYMFIFALPFFSFGIGSLFVLMMSMTADVCDLDELNNGVRREGIFGALYWWMVKLGFAVAGLLSGYIMAYVGFNPELEVQPEGAVFGLRLFYSGVPIIGTTIAILVMLRYNIDETKANEIRDALDKRKQSQIPSGYRPHELSKIWEASEMNGDPYPGLYGEVTSRVELKTLFDKTLSEKMHGLCFSPYEEQQDVGAILTEAQIQRRMDIVGPYTQWIRSFSCLEGNEYIPRIANAKGLKTLVGVWISDDLERNQREIKSLLTLVKEGCVNMIAVGNEVLLRNELEEEKILHYIELIRREVPYIPIGYVDAYYQFLERPKLVETCDVILINCYPFWEGHDLKIGLAYLEKMHALVQNVAKDKKVIISETGWPNKGTQVQHAKPSTLNAMRYFIESINWAKNNKVALFYFSSFDESWKVRQEGDVGKSWGLWSKKEHLKY